jgi:hypothetical protein
VFTRPTPWDSSYRGSALSVMAPDRRRIVLRRSHAVEQPSDRQVRVRGDRREVRGGRLLPALDKAAKNWLICSSLALFVPDGLVAPYSAVIVRANYNMTACHATRLRGRYRSSNRKSSLSPLAS